MKQAIESLPQLTLSALALLILSACGNLNSASPSNDQSSVASTAPRTYQLTLTNGGAMPMSPPTVWIAKKRAGVPIIGADSSAGQRKICETGDSSDFKTELSLNQNVIWVHTEAAPILPGEAIKIQVPEINLNAGESLYVDFMYGKTRNVCGGVFDFDLQALQSNQVNELRGGDGVFTSGAYASPNVTLIANSACAVSSNPVACLRSLAAPLSGASQYRVLSFVGYSPSVLTAIENIFGPGQSDQLIVPTGGDLSYQLQ